MLDVFAWFWIGCGVVSGAVMGSRFSSPTFLGGYDAWPRRLVRLGHIAFFGTGLLCLGLAGTLARHDIGARWSDWAMSLMAAGAVGMPVLCFASARWRGLVPLFAGPVACIGAASAIVWVRIAVVMLGGAR